MIGETTTITGPSFRSGVMARMVELMELSRMMAACRSMWRRAQVTAFSGVP